LLEAQLRISNKWKLELERSSAAYERVIEQLQVDLKNSVHENVHWRTEIHKAVVTKQKVKLTRQS